MIPCDRFCKMYTVIFFRNKAANIFPNCLVNTIRHANDFDFSNGISTLFSNAHARQFCALNYNSFFYISLLECICLFGYQQNKTKQTKKQFLVILSIKTLTCGCQKSLDYKHYRILSRICICCSFYNYSKIFTLVFIHSS